jgi:hypothetical protein
MPVKQSTCKKTYGLSEEKDGQKWSTDCLNTGIRKRKRKKRLHDHGQRRSNGLTALQMEERLSIAMA